jgi:DNA-directed RNA polymerase subunit RPC12/RpoP
MNTTYHCTTCHKSVREQISAASAVLDCPECHHQIAIPPNAVAGTRLNRCLVCPSVDLYARKDFPQWLGLTLVILGFLGSCVAWAYYLVFWTFAILFTTALIDLLLYMFMGESLTCYRCGAQYRGCDEVELHGGFDLETHERYRQLAARISPSPLSVRE